MITSLNIKNIATYNAINGVQIDNLKKVNFFFGFNGSGKSTIAKYLRNIGLEPSNQNPQYNQCSNIGYNNTQHHILTFNEEFIEENFKKSDEFKGVFSLNQTNTLIDQQIANKETIIGNLSSQITKYDSKKVLIENDQKAKLNQLLDYCWSHRSAFSTFSKINLSFSGSKLNHFAEIKKKLLNPVDSVLQIEELNELYKNLYEKELKIISGRINVRIYQKIRKIETTINEKMQRVIVGNDDVEIAKLIQTLDSTKWVESGIAYLDKTNEICPFCQNKTIDLNLKEQFEKFFDETYKNSLSEIEQLKDQYIEQTNQFIQNLGEIQNEYNAESIVSKLVLELRELFTNNTKSIEYKLKHSNEKKEIISISSKKDSLSLIIKLINENNLTHESLDAKRSELTTEIWKYIADKCKQEVLAYQDREEKYSRILLLCATLKGKINSNIITEKQSIESLRTQTVNTKDAVDNINLILKNAGFNGFEIDEKSVVNNISRYYLKRPNSTSGSIFSTLSEGEKNFISFLYFYQLCIGTDDISNNGNKKKIVVIDDPVSSLDSQALFIVSTLIHSIIERKGKEPKAEKKTLKNNHIAQVFVFTHNIYFYKEVSFEKRPICTDYWHYRIIKINNDTKVDGEYNKSIFDDYSLMWKTMKEIKANIPANSSLNIMISNSMRRIIESYVNFIGYGKDSWAALLSEDRDSTNYYIKCAFISTINDESHKITVLDSVYYQKIINEQPQILFDVFALIFKKIGKEHYEMMMGEQL